MNYQLFHSWHTEDKGSRYANPTFDRNGEIIKDQEGKYGPDTSVDFILDFYRRHKDDSTFVYYPMALPHWAGYADTRFGCLGRSVPPARRGY